MEEVLTGAARPLPAAAVAGCPMPHLPAVTRPCLHMHVHVHARVCIVLLLAHFCRRRAAAAVRSPGSPGLGLAWCAAAPPTFAQPSALVPMPACPSLSPEVNSILSDTMGILQQFLAASSAAAMGGGAGVLGSGMVSDLPPSDPFK
jgi:hypothetical protein